MLGNQLSLRNSKKMQDSLSSCTFVRGGIHVRRNNHDLHKTSNAGEDGQQLSGATTIAFVVSSTTGTARTAGGPGALATVVLQNEKKLVIKLVTSSMRGPGTASASVSRGRNTCRTAP